MPDIRHLIPIDAPPETVYPLVSTPRGLSRWWTEDAPEPDAKGGVALGFFDRTTVYRLEPLERAAPRTARWVCTTGEEWEGRHLEFVLEPVPTGTRLRFTHARWRKETDYFTSCTTTWGELLYRLKATAEGHGRGPLFLRNALAL